MTKESTDYLSDEALLALAARVAETAANVRAHWELGYRNDPSDFPPGAPRPLPGPPGTPTDADWYDVRASYAWIPEYFATKIGPDPASFEGQIAEMAKVERQLAGAGVSSLLATDVEAVAGTLKHWGGDAADAFRDQYVRRLGYVTANQAAVATMLRLAATANRDIYIKARQDLEALARSAIEAIEASRGWGHAVSLSVVLSVASAVVTVIGGVVTPGGAGAWAIVAGFSALGSLTPSLRDTGLELSLAAPTVDGVVTNLVDALTAHQELVVQQEKKIIDALTTNLVEMTTPGPDSRPLDEAYYRSGGWRLSGTGTEVDHGIYGRDRFLIKRPRVIDLSRNKEDVKREFVIE